MKSFFSILFTYIILTSAIQAQTEKGNYMLGGSTNIIGGYAGALPNQLSLGFGKNKSGSLETTYTNFNLSSNGGYFVGNGLLVGCNIGMFYGNYKETNTTPVPDEVNEYHFTNFSVAPLVRYYINQGSKTQYFAEARLGLAIQKFDEEDSDDIALVGAKVGAAIFLSKKVSLDLFFDFSGGRSKFEENGTTTTVFDSDMGFGLGFDIFL